MILIRNGCWEAVRAETAESHAAVSEDSKQLALGTNCLNLKNYNYSLVLDATDARVAWKKLESAFQDLQRKFTSTQFVNRSSVEVDGFTRSIMSL